MNLIPHNISPRIFSGSAVLLGYILADDMTAREQNAVGNWLMLTAQVLCTNGFYRQVVEERENARKYNSRKFIYSKEEIDLLKEIIKRLNKEIEILERQL